MGDRSNVVIETQFGKESSRVYLYSHWSGTSILESILHGLRSNRVDDPPYLARIIFEHMIRNDIGRETGFGISAFISDNEHPIPVITVGGWGSPTTVHFEDVQGEKLVEPIDYKKFLEAQVHVDSTNYYSFDQVMHTIWGRDLEEPEDADYLDEN